MATLSDALNADTSGYQPVSKNMVAPYQGVDYEPFYNPMLRCPLPPVSVTPDSLRQFYIGGQVPQMRLLSPPNSTQGQGNTYITKTSVINNTSGGGSTTVVTSPVAKTASFSTPFLAPGASYSGSVIMAKGFQLLFATSNNPCEIRLYSTAAAQSNDSARDLDEPTAAGIAQGIITDIALDTAPYQWIFNNRVGNNGDSPQTQLIYITVFNISDSIGTAMNITLTYVPMES